MSSNNTSVPGAVPERLLEMFADSTRPAAFVINYSGGKDSHRMLGFLCERFPAATKYVVMADTGFEHVSPVPAAEWSRAQVARYGLSLSFVRNPNKTYLQMVERRGKFPSAETRQCTSDLKRGPIEKFIRGLKEKRIVNCLGIRAEESHARAKQSPWAQNRSLSVAGREVWDWKPIFHETLPEVLDWHWRHGERLHPVYVPEFHTDAAKGGYLRRFSCRVCIFSTAKDLVAIEEHDPEAFRTVSDLEQKIGFTMRAGQSLVQITAVAREPAAQQPQLTLF